MGFAETDIAIASAKLTLPDVIEQTLKTAGTDIVFRDPRDQVLGDELPQARFFFASREQVNADGSTTSSAIPTIEVVYRGTAAPDSVADAKSRLQHASAPDIIDEVVNYNGTMVDQRLQNDWYRLLLGTKACSRTIAYTLRETIRSRLVRYTGEARLTISSSTPSKDRQDECGG